MLVSLVITFALFGVNENRLGSHQVKPDDTFTTEVSKVEGFAEFSSEVDSRFVTLSTEVQNKFDLSGDIVVGDSTFEANVVISGEANISNTLYTKNTSNKIGINNDNPSVGLHVGTGVPNRLSGAIDEFYCTGKAEFDGYTYFDGKTYFNYQVFLNHATTVKDDYRIYLGTQSDSGLAWDNTETYPCLKLGLQLNETNQSGNFLIVNLDYMAKDYLKPKTVNPTLCIFSAVNPETDETQWLSFYHNQTDGVIETGKGDILLSSEANINVNNNRIINLATPVNSTDAATKQFVLDNAGGGYWTESEGVISTTYETSITDKLNVDEINEYTAANGVSIEGLLIKDRMINYNILGNTYLIKLLNVTAGNTGIYWENTTNRIRYYYDNTSKIALYLDTGDIWIGNKLSAAGMIKTDIIEEYTEAVGIVFRSETIDSFLVRSDTCKVYTRLGIGNTGSSALIIKPADLNPAQTDAITIQNSAGTTVFNINDSGVVEVRSGILQIDRIKEYTASQGVSIEGMLLKDGTIYGDGSNLTGINAISGITYSVDSGTTYETTNLNFISGTNIDITTDGSGNVTINSTASGGGGGIQSGSVNGDVPIWNTSTLTYEPSTTFTATAMTFEGSIKLKEIHSFTDEFSWHTFIVTSALSTETVFTFEVDTTDKTVDARMWTSDRQEIGIGISYETGDQHFYVKISQSLTDEGAFIKWRLFSK